MQNDTGEGPGDQIIDNNSDPTADSSSRPRKITARVLAGLNIAQIGALLAKAPTVESRLCALLEKDRRAGVRRLAVRERTRQRLREAEEARELLQTATKRLDHAATKKLIHKNKAARTKSRLQRLILSIKQGA